MLLDDIFNKQNEVHDNAYASVKKQDEQIYLISFLLNEARFAIPITQIKEIVDYIQITPFPIQNGVFMGIVNLHGHLVPVLDPQKIKQDYCLKNTSLLRMIVCENTGLIPFIISGDSVKKVAAPHELLATENKKFSRVVKINNEIMQLLDFNCPDSIEIFSEAN